MEACSLHYVSMMIFDNTKFGEPKLCLAVYFSEGKGRSASDSVKQHLSIYINLKTNLRLESMICAPRYEAILNNKNRCKNVRGENRNNMTWASSR